MEYLCFEPFGKYANAPACISKLLPPYSNIQLPLIRYKKPFNILPDFPWERTLFLDKIFTAEIFLMMKLASLSSLKFKSIEITYPYNFYTKQPCIFKLIIQYLIFAVKHKANIYRNLRERKRKIWFFMLKNSQKMYLQYMTICYIIKIYK